MKKIIALVLALVMVLSLSTVAFAKRNTTAFADIAAGMLYVPAQNLANVVVQNHEKITEDLNAVSAYANNVVLQVKTAVDNTVAMANGLVYTVAATYQLGGRMILGAARLIDGRDYMANTFTQWIDRCIKNSVTYEGNFVNAIAEIKEDIYQVLVAANTYTNASYRGSKNSFLAYEFNHYGPDAVEFLQDAEHFLPGEEVADGITNIVHWLRTGNHKQQVPD